MLDQLFYIKMFLLLASLCSIAYFAGTETAIMSITTPALNRLKEKYPGKVPYWEYWEQYPNHIITALLIGTNFSCIAAGVLSASISIDLSRHHAFYKWLVPIAGTVAILLLGEIFPKIYCRYNHERVSVSNIMPLVKFSKFILPLSDLFVNMAERLMRLLKVNFSGESPFLTREELKLLLSLSEKSASLQSSAEDPVSVSQRKMLTNILSFVDRRVLQVMRPRSGIIAVDISQKFVDMVPLLLSSKYSRIPVYRNSLDNIVGIIYTKDLTITLCNHELFLLEDIIRPAHFVPDNASVSHVLREFKKGRQHMAIVVDEYGTTVGLVTIEDLVEEIVGEIYDEFDIAEKKIIPMPENCWVISGDESLRAINEELGLKLHSPNVTTINGLIMARLGHIPVMGEEFELDNLKIEILESDNKRIKKLRLRKI